MTLIKWDEALDIDSDRIAKRGTHTRDFHKPVKRKK